MKKNLFFLENKAMQLKNLTKLVHTFFLMIDFNLNFSFRLRRTSNKFLIFLHKFLKITSMDNSLRLSMIKLTTCITINFNYFNNTLHRLCPLT